MKSVSIIPEELLDTFRIASEQEVRITLPDGKAANTLRFRFHNARKRMRLDNHPLLEKAERVVFQLKDNVLTAGPYTQKFGTALEDALKPFRQTLDETKSLEFAQEADALAEEQAAVDKEKEARKAEEDAWLAEEAARLEKVQKKALARKPQKSLKEMLK